MTTHAPLQVAGHWIEARDTPSLSSRSFGCKNCDARAVVTVHDWDATSGPNDFRALLADQLPEECPGTTPVKEAAK